VPYGTVILVDETKYRFKDLEAVYGSTISEGLVLRRRYIDKDSDT